MRLLVTLLTARAPRRIVGRIAGKGEGSRAMAKKRREGGQLEELVVPKGTGRVVLPNRAARERRLEKAL